MRGSWPVLQSFRVVTLLGAVLGVGTVWPGPGGAAEPSAEPVLRIETEMHTAGINRIASDATGRYLVTGSFDKTCRVWELPSGRLLQILRPPLGVEEVGLIYSVAMSPGGDTVACAGYSRVRRSRQGCAFHSDLVAVEGDSPLTSEGRARRGTAASGLQGRFSPFVNYRTLVATRTIRATSSPRGYDSPSRRW